ncbi:MAG: TrbC/VirB2 family protein [Gammaproteobacteria bacterium]|nr:TrbC/VirB2 family protein [Gammaproteobacteria bacterium]
MLRKTSPHLTRIYQFCFLLLATPYAFADDGSGQSMPWVGPLQMIMDSISGPVAKIVGTIAIIIAGFGIAFGESGSGVRRLFQIVFGLAIAFTAASIVATVFQPGTGVPS